jgi:RNA polymerase sigma factor (sigma-70 family)
VGTQPAVQQVAANQHDSGIIAVATFGIAFPQLPVMDPVKPARKAPAVRPTEPRPGVGDAESSFALLARAREGDQQALDDLLSRYLPRLQRWAHGRLPPWARDARETQDLVQDTLTHVWKKLDSFVPRHEGAFYAYMRQALMNRVRDEIRRIQRRGPVDALDSSKPDHGPSPLEAAIGHQALERYEKALERLRPQDREAIILRIEMDMSYDEIADALGKPSVAAAHMAVSRALVKLAEEMSSERP